jgi:hypothetical protein
MTESDDATFDPLLNRLRDLGLVDIDALLAGTTTAEYTALIAAYRDDLVDALRTARERAKDLHKRIAGDPLSLLDAAPSVRARDGGHDAAARAADKLTDRAAACRALARLDDLVARVYPRLFEADRRIGG